MGGQSSLTKGKCWNAVKMTAGLPWGERHLQGAEKELAMRRRRRDVPQGERTGIAYCHGSQGEKGDGRPADRWTQGGEVCPYEL